MDFVYTKLLKKQNFLNKRLKMNWTNVIIYSVMLSLGLMFWWAVISKFMEVL